MYRHMAASQGSSGGKTRQSMTVYVFERCVSQLAACLKFHHRVTVGDQGPLLRPWAIAWAYAGSTFYLADSEDVYKR